MISCSSASRTSSDSGVEILSRLLGNVEELGLKALLGLKTGDGDAVRPVLAALTPLICTGFGDVERRSSGGAGMSFTFPGDSERPPAVESEDCR